MQRPFITRMALMFAVGTAAFLQACNTAYVPNTVNVPMMRNEGEMRIYGDYRGNLQGAYSISDNIGVMANAHFVPDRDHRDANDSIIQDGAGRQFDVGVGYQGVLQPNLIMSGDLIADVYAGVGFGSLNLNNKQDQKSYEVSALKMFVQPSIGFSHRYLEVAFAPRFVGLMYGEPTTGYTDAELDTKELPNRSKPMHWFAEPTVTVRAGIQEVKLQFQIGQSFQLTSPEIAHEKVILVVGLSVNLGRTANRTPMEVPR